MRSLVLVFLAISGVASAKPIAIAPHVGVKLTRPPGGAPATVNSHTLFLNNCRPNGCAVGVGMPSSTTDVSDLYSCGEGTAKATNLSALTSSADWNGIVSCIKTIMAPYNITVTDQDPGTADHFEVMIAGTSSEFGCETGVLGIANAPCGAVGDCDPYYPDALVFDFANSALAPPFNLDTNYVCGVAAQEIAHAWALDHVTLANDPLTYKQYTPPLSYHDNATCGSDCVNGMSPLGLTCTGQGMNATHTCFTGGSTQNEVQMITSLFGTGVPPPTVAITAPANNSTQGAGKAFPITATCSPPSGDNVQKMTLSIDGTAGSTTTSSPASFTAPTNLALGNHAIDVSCATTKGGLADAMVSVTLVNSCSQDSDCTTAGDICYQQACIPGPTTSGGLGQPCTMNSDCLSGQCGNDGTTSMCVVPCDTSNDQCPSGFGCLGTGTTGNTGVCWAGADNGGGGCDTTNTGRSSLLLGLSLAGVLALWKRPKRARA